MEFLSLENIEYFAHKYGYFAVFLGIMLENLGLPLPGETITIVGGFLAGSKELNYWFVLLSAIAGATLGGNFGYWIGRYGGWNLLLNAGKIFRVSEKKLEKLKIQVGENAGKTVFVGRFLALLRIFASPLAGIAEMPYLKFMAYNLAGAIAWASVMVTLSYFVGKIIPLEQLVAWVAKFAFLALFLFIGWIVVSFWLESKSAAEE
ncbi:MAG TPA: DedA family protein [Allocoleopsis sp.]